MKMDLLFVGVIRPEKKNLKNNSSSGEFILYVSLSNEIYFAV